MLHEIELGDHTYYAKGHSATHAANKVQATFGTRWTRPIITGRVKYSGNSDC